MARSYIEIYGADGKMPFVELANRLRSRPKADSTATPERSLAMSGARGRNWHGGIKHSNGYRLIFLPDHPRANSQGYIPEHVAVCEMAIGKFLPEDAIPHHINENKLDNSPGNLVILQNRREHNVIHRRMRALKECGHSDWLKCTYCKQYDAPDNLDVFSYGRVVENGRHKACHSAYEVARQQKKRMGL